ncbi:hypothetical protein Acr_02g0012800 [Actinidia rufa]|uniref:Uncharacterized protein n=1 Tax=Actinidia rufa TaxID=165716 RepID=A0A7J0E9G0_9ERIC|nr:hypothetical protein Acr_02g0012800 [Actinidia rufa]
MHQCQVNQVEWKKSLCLQTARIQELEAAAAFCGHAQYLSPLYYFHVENLVKDGSSTEEHLTENAAKELEAAAAFCGHAQYLSPLYYFHVENLVKDGSSTEEHLTESSEKYTFRIPDYGSNYVL